MPSTPVPSLAKEREAQYLSALLWESQLGPMGARLREFLHEAHPGHHLASAVADTLGLDRHRFGLLLRRARDNPDSPLARALDSLGVEIVRESVRATWLIKRPSPDQSTPDVSPSLPRSLHGRRLRTRTVARHS